MRALDPEKYEVIPIGIAKDGRWLIGRDPLAALKEGVQRSLPADLIPATFWPDPEEPGLITSSQATDLQGASPARQSFDVVFPVLHGPYGEDGTVQGMLELANVPYVGSGVAASGASMDKVLMKGLFRAAGLPILDYLVVKRKEVDSGLDEIRQDVEERLGYPCFVKPANLGSSVGVSKVKGPEDLRAGAAKKPLATTVRSSSKRRRPATAKWSAACSETTSPRLPSRARSYREASFTTIGPNIWTTLRS